MSIDNPYYFFNDKSTKLPETTSISKGFSLFRKRSSSNSSNKSNKSSSATNTIISPKSKTFNSATLSTDAAVALTFGTKRGSLRSLLRSSSSTNQSSTNSYNFNNNISSHDNNNNNNNNIRNKHCNSDYDTYSNVSRDNDRNVGNINGNSYRNRFGSCTETAVSYADEVDDVFVSNHRKQLSNSYSDSSTNGFVSSGIRRHSIGTFINRDRVRCGSHTDEVPKSFAPKPPIIHHTTSSHKRKTGGNIHGMDDILIVTARQSEAAILWANFLRTRFDKITKQRGRQPFNFLHLKIDEEPITSEISQRCHSTKLQIVILCTSLISLPQHFLMSQLSLIIKPEIVLGILLEVSEEMVLEMHRNALPSFKKWRRCVVRKQDQSLIGNVLGIATDILGRALCQRPPCSDMNTGISKISISDAFTILPRKVKIGQNKVVALLSEPLTKDDWIKIKIEKNGQIIDVVNFKKRNPYTLQFTIPETCMEISTMIEIRIEKNEKVLGVRPVKCESRLRELEQLLKSQDSPMDFMCQSLGLSITERHILDSHLQKAFQKNVPPNFHLLNCIGSSIKQTGHLSKDHNSEEYPTLLHFAAKWGLEHLSLQIMECPGGDTACEIRNSFGRTPADLAENGGFTKLAESLRSFSQMNEFTTMYHYFKGITDSTNTSTKVVIEQHRSLDGKSNKLLDNRPKKQPNDSKDIIQIGQEYMEMNCSGSSCSNIDEQDTTKHTKQSLIINAVTNLNYINIENYEETKDNEITSSSPSASSASSVPNKTDTEIMTNELKILEPAYYESNAINKTDKFSQECLNVLENCTTTTSSLGDSDYLIQPSNIPVNQYSDYLTHPSNRPVSEFINQGGKQSTNNLSDKSLSTTTNQSNDYLTQPPNKCGLMDEQSHLLMNFNKTRELIKSKSASQLKRQGSDTSKTSVDDELVEIINDFKNNVFTIQEVEHLVASWKNRNDVQKSFQDKQEQLERMRSEYDRIQNNMKIKMKRPTPFERVKNLFLRNKSTENDYYDENGCNGKEISGNASTKKHLDELKSLRLSINQNNNNNTNNNQNNCLNNNNRPMSSLSMSSSSSSSGRMSTGSVCSGTSLGDSGTHSDHEERRSFSNSNTNHTSTNTSTCRIGSPGSLIDNYLIPPTPRPVTQSIDTPDGFIKVPTKQHQKNYKINHPKLPLSTSSSQSSLVLTPSSPSSSNYEHYLMFPSNIPVNANNVSKKSSENQNHHQHDYINIMINSPTTAATTVNGGLNTIDETKECMNSVDIVPDVPSGTKTLKDNTGISVQKIKISKSSEHNCPDKIQLSSFKPNISTNVTSTNKQAALLSPTATITDNCVQFTRNNDVEQIGYQEKKKLNASGEFDKILSNEAIDEMCKNINELDVKTQDNILHQMKTSTECNPNASCSIDTINHDYMNI